MTVYVDSIVQWPTRLRCFRQGSCHLAADTLEELHTFARRLGLRRSWFQDHPVLAHYDLTPGRRAAAVALGAVELEGKEMIRRIGRRRRRGG